MLPLLNKLRKSKKDKNVGKDNFFTNVQQLSTLSDEVEKTKKSLEGVDYRLLTEHADDCYISLTDFLELIDHPEVSLSTVLSKCKHVCELEKLKKDVSAVEVHAIVDGSHIILCKDADTCEEHKDYSGNKIRILTARRML